MLNAEKIRRMRRVAILVNTARGGLVDTAALVASLRTGHLAGAGIDVFDPEPATADDPLLTLPNVVLAPHVAWLTQETLARSVHAAVDNCHRLVSGRMLMHQVA
jgi:phosphoglycerate dehydrogenase-like enzyme